MLCSRRWSASLARSHRKLPYKPDLWAQRRNRLAGGNNLTHFVQSTQDKKKTTKTAGDKGPGHGDGGVTELPSRPSYVPTSSRPFPRACFGRHNPYLGHFCRGR